MIQTLSTNSPSQLRANWPEIGIISQHEIFSRRRSIRRAFDSGNFLGIIIECPPIDFGKRDTRPFQQAKQKRKPLDSFFYNAHATNTFSSNAPPLDAFSFEPFAFTTETAATRVEKIVESFTADKTQSKLHLTQKMLHVIATDLVVLNYAWNANLINVNCVQVQTGSPHRDSWEAFALRTISPREETTFIYKDGEIIQDTPDIDYRISGYGRPEWPLYGYEVKRPPPDSLLLLKGIGWGKAWRTIHPSKYMPYVDQIRLQKLYSIGLGHSSPKSERNEQSNGQRVAIRYGVEADLRARNRMHKMSRRQLSTMES